MAIGVAENGGHGPSFSGLEINVFGVPGIVLPGAGIIDAEVEGNVLGTGVGDARLEMAVFGKVPVAAAGRREGDARVAIVAWLDGYHKSGRGRIGAEREADLRRRGLDALEEGIVRPKQ